MFFAIAIASGYHACTVAGGCSIRSTGWSMVLIASATAGHGAGHAYKERQPFARKARAVALVSCRFRSWRANSGFLSNKHHNYHKIEARNEADEAWCHEFHPIFAGFRRLMSWWRFCATRGCYFWIKTMVKPRDSNLNVGITRGSLCSTVAVGNTPYMFFPANETCIDQGFSSHVWCSPMKATGMVRSVRTAP